MDTTITSTKDLADLIAEAKADYASQGPMAMYGHSSIRTLAGHNVSARVLQQARNGHVAVQAYFSIDGKSISRSKLIAMLRG